MASMSHVLAIFRSFYPTMDPRRFMGSYACGTTGDRIDELLAEVKEVAESFTDDIVSPEDGPAAPGG
jgi:hypothetical protein